MTGAPAIEGVPVHHPEVPMPVSDFYRAFWDHMATVEGGLVPNQRTRQYGPSVGWRDIQVYGGFKQKYAAEHAGSMRDVVVQVYTNKRHADGWESLVDRLRRAPPTIAESTLVFDLDAGENDAAAQVLWVHRRISPTDQRLSIPALAAWMAPAWRTLGQYVEGK